MTALFGTDGNRVAMAVERVRERLERLEPADVDALDADMAIDAEEYFRFQELQSQSHALGQLSTDEAQTVYVALGAGFGTSSNGGWARDTDTATKVAVTLLMSELLTRRIRAAG